MFCLWVSRTFLLASMTGSASTQRALCLSAFWCSPHAKCDEGRVGNASSGGCPLEVSGVALVALLAARVGVVWSGSVLVLPGEVSGAEKVFQGPCVVGVVGEDLWFWCTCELLPLGFAVRLVRGSPAGCCQRCEGVGGGSVVPVCASGDGEKSRWCQSWGW